MDTFFTYLKKGLVATFLLFFALAVTYTPQDWNKVETAQAKTPVSTEPTQILNHIELVPINISDAVSAAKNTIVAWATTNTWVKENVLDGVAWLTAKNMIASMTQNLLDWINNGFAGSPMFVQNLQKYLRNVGDDQFGELQHELLGSNTFLCDPFKVDVVKALSEEYYLQFNPDHPELAPPKADLTKINGNVETFLNGTQDSFTQEGGWDTWFSVVTEPQSFTPYGNYIQAKEVANVRLLESKKAAETKANWGDGFLSGEICNVVKSAGISKQDCQISKPGQLISKALSSSLDSPRQSLIQADEFNEVLAALFSQLGNTALTGANGLLGLSSGTGYTYSNLKDVFTGVAADALSGDSNLALLKKTRKTQQDFNVSAKQYLTNFLTEIPLSTNTTAQLDAQSAVDDINNTIVPTTQSNITALDNLISQYNAATDDPKKQADVMSNMLTLPLYDEQTVATYESDWDNIRFDLTN